MSRMVSTGSWLLLAAGMLLACGGGEGGPVTEEQPPGGLVVEGDSPYPETPPGSVPGSDDPGGGGSSQPPQPEPQPQPQPPEPSPIRFGEGDEFMTRVMGRARDFSWTYNLYEPHSLELKLANGSVSARITGSDPGFFPIYPGLFGCVNFESGENFPIDPDRYHRLALRACTTADNFGQALAFYFFRKGSDWLSGFTQFVRLKKGCAVYVVDLRQNSNWNGRVVGMRVDPELWKTGDVVSIDWIRLTGAADPANVQDIPWRDLGAAGGKLELFLDVDQTGKDGFPIGTVDSAPASGSFSWGKNGTGILPQDLQVGTYWVHARLDGQDVGYLPRPIRIDGSPLLTFTSPSRTSGQDYATTENGAPWDFRSESSTGTAANVDSAAFTGGALEAMNTSNDPSFTFKVSRPIDTSTYRYLTFDFWSEVWFYSKLSGHGGMSRIFWMTGYDGKIQTSIDIIINGPNQWLTWSFDLTKIPLVGGPYPWTSDQWRILRFDPNENEKQYPFHWKLRNARLTGPPIAGPTFSIDFTVADPEGDPVQVTLYRDSDDRGFDGTQIGEITATKSGHLPWTGAGVPRGEWFVYGCADDGFNHRACRYADAPVLLR